MNYYFEFGPLFFLEYLARGCSDQSHWMVGLDLISNSQYIFDPKLLLNISVQYMVDPKAVNKYSVEAHDKLSYALNKNGIFTIL